MKPSDNIAKLKQRLGIDRDFTEYDWGHIVSHYNASLQSKLDSQFFIPDASLTTSIVPSTTESSLTIWHRRGLAIEYCLQNPPDAELFTDPLKNQGIITWDE